MDRPLIFGNTEVEKAKLPILCPGNPKQSQCSRELQAKKGLEGRVRKKSEPILCCKKSLKVHLSKVSQEGHAG